MAERGMTERKIVTPMDELSFPVRCTYADCDEGPFKNADEVDEHITESHLAEAVWDFAFEHMKASGAGEGSGRE